TIKELEAKNMIRRENGVVIDAESGKPFAGDIDAVAILDAKTGRPVTGQRYQDIVEKLKQSGVQAQHGAEANLVGDIVRKATEGLDPRSVEYKQAYEEAYTSATRLADKLNQNHLKGKEQVYWTHARGTYKGPQANKVGDWYEMTSGDVPTAPIDARTMAMPARPLTD
ncbi:MAG: hypothetical protein AAFY28_16145, partial [Actinomycetota bacterium]